MKWSILQKWSQTVNLIHTYLARRRWYDSNRWDFMKITHEQHVSYTITTFRWFCLMTIWMRLEWIQSILSPFSSTPKKRPYDAWSSAIFRNIISLEIRCCEDVEKMTFQGGQCDSRVLVFCKEWKKKKTYFLSQSMMISITWYVIWTIPIIMTIKYMISDFRRSLWIYHIQRNWREEVFGNKFYVYYEIIIL